MTPETRPAAVPFDPGSGQLPPSLEPVLTDPTRQILLLVAAEADDAAARTAIALAELRATRGLATVLADADLDAPRLHRLLEVENLEGLVDVFLFGASLARVTVRPEGRSFELAPAGAYAPDPAEVLQSPRWARIAEELPSADALLLVFVPAAAAGSRALSGRVGQALIIGDDRAVERAILRLDAECEVVGTVEPAAEPGAAAREQPAQPYFAAPDLTEPVVIRQQRKARKTSPVLLLALLAAVGAAAWFGYQELFGGAAVTAAIPTPVADTAGPQEPGEPVETPIPYSVALEAHPDLATAMERVRLLDRAEPGISFYLAPVSVRGTLYYRLLGGPAADQESARALMQRLVDGGHKGEMDDWAVRPRPLSFHLGDYDARAEAESRVDALAATGIPAYVVPQRFESGQLRYRVYGGAYENRAEAEVMREMLENAGETARLIPRVGEPTA